MRQTAPAAGTAVAACCRGGQGRAGQTEPWCVGPPWHRQLQASCSNHCIACGAGQQRSFLGRAGKRLSLPSAPPLPKLQHSWPWRTWGRAAHPGPRPAAPAGMKPAASAPCSCQPAASGGSAGCRLQLRPCVCSLRHPGNSPHKAAVQRAHPGSTTQSTLRPTHRQAAQLSPQRLKPCLAPRQLQHCWAGGQRPGAGGSQRQRRRKRLVVAWAAGWRDCLRCGCRSVCCSHAFSPLFCRQNWLCCCLLASAGVAGAAATAAATGRTASAVQVLQSSLQLVRCCKCGQHTSSQPLPAGAFAPGRGREGEATAACKQSHEARGRHDRHCVVE